jgi:hypothetical protein
MIWPEEIGGEERNRKGREGSSHQNQRDNVNMTAQ